MSFYIIKNHQMSSYIIKSSYIIMYHYMHHISSYIWRIRFDFQQSLLLFAELPRRRSAAPKAFRAAARRRGEGEDLGAQGGRHSCAEFVVHVM
jgi:hypothetical protein